jgi:class 3 adenylate cyclase/TolB-like protein/Tfp pilus assembly protein PilF
VEAQTERRLAAVLAVDTVGYTRLMGRDEVGTHGRLRAIRRELVDPSVKMHGGRIVKSTGDGVLVEFQSAVEAAACAIEIQRAMLARNADVPEDTRIVFRMGLNVGDLIIDDGDIFGDGVNVAVRLEGLCVPGGICISRAVRDQIRDKAPYVFDDLGEQVVKNVERPVRAFQIRLESASGEQIEPRGSPPAGKASLISGRRAWIAAAVVLLALGGSAGAWWLLRDQSSTAKSSKVAEADGTPNPTARASIAVLPLTSLTVDGAGEYFADGLTEDIIAALGRFRDLTVISRSGVSGYKGKNPTSEEVGRALKVRYIAEGSVRQTSDRTRVTVNLTDASRNTLIWSDRFEVEPKDIFHVQDQITRQITGALALRVSAQELAQAAAKPPLSLEAYDLVLRGRDLLYRFTRATNAQARSLFERAIELDPSYAPAYVGLGTANHYSVVQGWTPDASGTLSRAEALARKAISLDDQNPNAHALLGRALVYFGDYDRAVDELKRAVSLNPSDADAQSGLMDVLLWAGDIPGSISAGEFLSRVQPTLTGGQAVDLAIAHVLADRPVDAIRTLETSIDANRTIRATHALLAVAYAQAGRKEDAAREAEVARSRFPLPRDEFGSLLRDPNHRKKLSQLLSDAGL